MATNTVHYRGFLLEPMALHVGDAYLSLVSVSDEDSLHQVLAPRSSVTADGLFDSAITAIDAGLDMAKNIVDVVRAGSEHSESDVEQNAQSSVKQYS